MTAITCRHLAEHNSIIHPNQEQQEKFYATYEPTDGDRPRRRVTYELELEVRFVIFTSRLQRSRRLVAVDYHLLTFHAQSARSEPKKLSAGKTKAQPLLAQRFGGLMLWPA